MDRSGFFKIEKRTLFFIAFAVGFAALMFTPFIYTGITPGGTSYPFICANIILCVAPLFSLIDGWFRAKDSNKKSGE